MATMWRTAIVSLALVAVASVASAQGWRGQGRMAGRVTDESGTPIEGVVVKCSLPSAGGGTNVTTNKKGEWALGGIAGGSWDVAFAKPGYEPRTISVALEESTPIPPVEIVLKKAAPDANQVIAVEMQKASALLKEKKFDEALAIYASLQQKYPQVNQFELQMARAYDLQGSYDKEIEHLKIYLQKDPNNIPVKLLTGGVMIAKGNADEGKALLATVDDAQVTEPAMFLNVGINLLNQNKPQDAMIFFDKIITRFPQYPDAYYYRGLASFNRGAELRPTDKPASDKHYDAGRADLTKFLAMAPSAPEAEMARKMLEQLK